LDTIFNKVQALLIGKLYTETDLGYYDQHQAGLDERKTVLLSAFGVGMSWSTAILSLDHCHISDIVEI